MSGPEALRQPAERDGLPAVRVPDGDVAAVDVFEDDPSTVDANSSIAVAA